MVEGESGSWDFKSQSAKSHRQSSLCSTFCTSHFSCISELQTSVSPLSLRTILIKSTFVHIAPLPGIGWLHGRGHCVLIPVALGPARAFVPVWKTLACGGCPASCSGRGWKGLLVTRLQFCFFPPSITLSMPSPSLTLQTSSGNQRGWGQRERRETEIASFGGSSSSGRPCQKPALHTSSPTLGLLEEHT